MGRYVDLSQTVTASYYDEEHEEWRSRRRTIEDLLDDLCDDYTTTDAVQVKHGEWQEENRRPRSSMFYCSICHRTAYDIQPTRDKAWKKRCRYAYCPNCGAKMDVKDGNGNEYAG